MSHSPEYRAWSHMKERCNNPRQKHYYLYGGRGITVCDRWKVFSNFYKDMGLRPTNKHSLDRIDNNSGYSPDNCRWTNQLVQTVNRSFNKNNSSGYRGVSWDKYRKRWYAQAMVNRKHIFLGYFDNPVKASEAYETHKKLRLQHA
jgi:hypothetical protein